MIFEMMMVFGVIDCVMLRVKVVVVLGVVLMVGLLIVMVMFRVGFEVWLSVVFVLR